MNKQWLTFCESYKKKLKNDAILSDRTIINSITRRYTSELSFSLSLKEVGYSYTSDDKDIFRLDAEDLKYLYNKYSNKLGEELVLEKQRLDDEYDSAVKLYTDENASK